ncbi:hypothetical protein [Mucilaginibacter antarcticus]|uniref:hypothetical protein n=1 Tax=Mucilaginibacter antarcticus TaxID=1855725 RepID=UPI00362F66A1
MKTRFLFPHGFRKIGIVIFLIGVILYAFSLCSDAIGEYVVTQRNLGNTIPIDIIFNDAILICLITGLLLVAFSKEKEEDEQIAQLRLDCLQWAIYFNYVLMLICVLVFNGGNFFAVMVYNMLTPLAFLLSGFGGRCISLTARY